MKAAKAHAVVVLPDPMFIAQRRRIVELAAISRLPAIYHLRQFVEAGGFLSYGASWRERWGLCRWPLTLALAGCAAALLLAGPHLVPALTPLPHRGALLAVSLVASALLLGWSLR